MLSSELAEVETLIASLASSEDTIEKGRSIRVAITSAIRSLSPATRRLSAKASIADHLEAATEESGGRRDVALLVCRCLGETLDILNEDGTGGLHFQRRVVSLVEKGTPDFAALVNLSEKRMHSEKYEALKELHRSCLEKLDIFCAIPIDPAGFASRRQEVFKLLNNQFLRSYLNPYGFSAAGNMIRSVLNQANDVLDTYDSNFGHKLQELSDFVEASIAEVSTRGDFFASSALRPFLATAKMVVSKIESESSSRLACSLKPRRFSPQTLERRYPLHESDRIIRIKIPLVNDGPGMAVETTAQLVCGSDQAAIGTDLIDIGTVPPGEFSVTVDVLIGSPIAALRIQCEISWRTARGAERHSNTFETVILAQRQDVNWGQLEESDPYSTEVARGDEFVGRRSKVLALVNRLRKAHMQSSYITGQKRVGKTSLSFAVQEVLRSLEADPARINIVYLEYGEYARKDADSTVEALGRAVAEQLLVGIPPAERPGDLDFAGSLAPLNRIAQLLATLKPDQKFLIVLDEFDEIHPEMYRFGPLAEAFFSNLRTLSAKPNIALMLIGGENMPFIIGAQGDQLNKFVREPLDYFSRSEEWEDFIELARQKGAVPLNWHESALTELFNHTNGHPYYTKLVCGRIFQNAIADRDAEITVDEVRRAIPGLIHSLDVNAFAHFWKDGIPAGREQAEVIELKRCRVLVAIARARRHDKPLNAESIVEFRGHAGLASSDVLPILSDFCRRDVLRENDKHYEFVIPLFEQWLLAKGVSKLISDTLGDEMADALQDAEDRAYVTSPEIASLIERWPVYRGAKISSEEVRHFLGQRSSFQEQRLLFKLLENIRFLSEGEVRDKLRIAHRIVTRHGSAVIPESRVQRRFDVIVTYVDGPAKSGSRYADRYVEENLISTTCVMEEGSFDSKVTEHEERRGLTINGVVIIDDIAATGRSLSDNVTRFVKKNLVFLKERNITVVVLALLATREADEFLRERLRRLEGVDIDFRTCEIIEDRYFAFHPNNRIWADNDEKEQARALALEVGRSVHKSNPMGFGDLGLLVVFSDTCPNNSLPILHAGQPNIWKPLFERPKN